MTQNLTQLVHSLSYVHLPDSINKTCWVSISSVEGQLEFFRGSDLISLFMNIYQILRKAYSLLCILLLPVKAIVEC
jgi:hypothetical protein